VLAAKIQADWGQPLVVESRPGAAGVIAADAVAKSAPDGYTWFFSGSSAVVASVFTPNPPLDFLRDLSPVNLMATIPFVLGVNPQLPAKTLAELVALAKAKPGTLNYGSPGNGSTPHLAMERFKQLAGIDMLHVPYRGVPPMVADMIGGQVQLGFIIQQAALPQVQGGKLRALAVSGAKRSLAAPEIPTVAESGYPGFDLVGWSSLHVPAKTPPAIIAKINAEVNKIIADPEVRKTMLAAGLEPVTLSVAEFDAFVKRDIERYGQVMKAANIKLD
ncbi:MAG TPA: tripartite tricarboxylate transporter substrate binding protein, partial [Burkholderiales bacterium]|nr:tripartite tricarboxylate transporter substrate binding protein [Burkholderiales bacterium]